MTDNRTTELRDKLRERGVKYDVKALRETEWTVNGVIWHANEYDGKLNVYVRNNDMLLTPEQAIAATLGSETCHLHYGEDDDGYDGWYCDECGGWFQAVRRDGHLVEPKHCQECGKAVKQ